MAKNSIIQSLRQIWWGICRPTSLVNGIIFYSCLFCFVFLISLLVKTYYRYLYIWYRSTQIRDSLISNFLFGFSAWLKDGDDPVIHNVNNRISDITGLSMATAEELQVCFCVVTCALHVQKLCSNCLIHYFIICLFMFL